MVRLQQALKMSGHQKVPLGIIRIPRPDGKLITLLNPEIIYQDNNLIPSIDVSGFIPYKLFLVPRYLSVIVMGFTLSKEKTFLSYKPSSFLNQSEEYNNIIFFGSCAQHAIDSLYGILLSDRTPISVDYTPLFEAFEDKKKQLFKMHSNKNTGSILFDTERPYLGYKYVLIKFST